MNDQKTFMRQLVQLMFKVRNGIFLHRITRQVAYELKDGKTNVFIADPQLSRLLHKLRPHERTLAITELYRPVRIGLPPHIDPTELQGVGIVPPEIVERLTGGTYHASIPPLIFDGFNPKTREEFTVSVLAQFSPLVIDSGEKRPVLPPFGRYSLCSLAGWSGKSKISRCWKMVARRYRELLG